MATDVTCVCANGCWCRSPTLDKIQAAIRVAIRGVDSDEE